MAEPPADQNRPPEPQPPGEPAPAPSGFPPPSDDAPTIISQSPPRPIRPGDAFPVALNGRRLAHFELIDAIGVGGMAAVIRARDTQLDRFVALKILPPEMAADPENVRRFHQEARAAAKLDHENIARVFFCGEDQGLHFIAFEFVEGENLRTVLDRRGRLPAGEAVHYVLQVATGLAHAAARGVVHRDIKPSNIIISANGRAKLVDMGLARSLEPQADHGLTQSGVTLGTFDYISPEQALEPREADVRSDIYSLGCTLYHMLTGRPPVPEGTAAKKLNHHQHVAPVDPRQLNPDVPDELAAVLAHMMAKDPRHRYQRAEHLVQHLIHLAGRLEGAPDVPDRLLFVDTALPHPPRHRPVLVAAAALAVLAGLVALQGMLPLAAPPDRPGVGENGLAGPPGEARPSEGVATAVKPVDSPVTAVPRPTPPAVVTRECGNARELAEFLAAFARQPAAEGEVVLTGDFDLTEEAKAANSRRVPGLNAQGQGKHLIIRSKDPNQPATIRLKYDTELHEDGTGGAPAWTALAVRGGHVELRGLRFQVDATQAQITMAAVQLHEGRLTLDRCEFLQSNPPRTASDRLSSLVVENGHAGLNACYFGVEGRGGSPVTPDHQNALSLEGSADVQVSQCAFAPHAALFRLSRGGGEKPSTLRLQHCSSLLTEGPAFLVEGGQDCELDVQDCLFSSPDQGVAGGLAGSLIHQAGEGAIHFKGARNRYHNLGNFWTRGAGDAVPVAGSWGAFQRALVANGGRDVESQPVAASPWAEQTPLKLLDVGKPEEAFKADVRQADLRPRPNYMVGVEACRWGRLYDAPLPPLEAIKPAAVAAKIVDPTKKAGNGVYPTLASAIEEATPGDEIQIRFNGLVAVKPVELTKASDDLTLRPAPGWHPVLTLGETSNLDATLFRLGDGKLKLEGLEFYVRPGRDEFTAQSVVDVIGAGQCALKDCVATLERTRERPLALVMLTDPSQVMKMDMGTARQQPPRVSLERCFVRGQGDLLDVRATRPLELSVSNSLVTLGGSFLNVEGHAKDSLKAEPVKVQLTQVTAYLTDYLVHLRAGKDGQGPVPVQVNSASNCLFASAAEGKAFVHLDGLEALEFQMKNQFRWEGGRQNAYSRFQPMLDQKPKGDEMPMPPFDQQKWKSFTNESDGFFGPAKFANPPEADAAMLAKAIPAQFKIKSEATQPAYGAEIDQLPRPAVVEEKGQGSGARGQGN